MIIKPQIQNGTSFQMSTDLGQEETTTSLNVKTSDGGKCQFQFSGHKESAPGSKEENARDRGSGKNKRKFPIQGEERAYEKDFMKLM